MSQTPTFKTYPFLKPFTGKKDGKNQVMIRVKIGLSSYGKIIYDKPIDIKLLTNKGESIKITKEEFKNRTNNKELMLRIYEVDALIGKALFVLTMEHKKIDLKNLFDYTYRKATEINDTDEFVENDDVKKIFGYPVPRKVWETFISETYTDEITGEPVLFEELEDIAKGIEGDYYEEKNQKEIKQLDYNERYKRGLYDKENIFDCFGFCWSNQPKVNESLVPDSYKSLLLRLHDYRFNENPPENVKYFNDDWIDDFLKFLVEEGYSTYRPRTYHPFNLTTHKIKLINSPRSPYRYAGFEKLVKHLKRYIFLMQKYQIISYQRNPKFINAKDYVGRNVQKTPYTRREHSLTNDEFTSLCTKDFNDTLLNNARDMFILAVLGGGFRGEELYNHELTLEKRDNQFILHIYNSKTNTSNINPVFGELNNVIQRWDGKLPNFLPNIEFRKALKVLASKLDFNRVIVSPNTFMNSKEKMSKEILKDIFSTYFARKTCISLLDSFGMSEEDIIEFTSHSKIDTLKHYKGRLSVANKISVLRKHNLL